MFEEVQVDSNTRRNRNVRLSVLVSHQHKSQKDVVQQTLNTRSVALLIGPSRVAVIFLARASASPFTPSSSSTLATSIFFSFSIRLFTSLLLLGSDILLGCARSVHKSQFDVRARWTGRTSARKQGRLENPLVLLCHVV
jgi:hypothetical protein